MARRCTVIYLTNAVIELESAVKDIVYHYIIWAVGQYQILNKANRFVHKHKFSALRVFHAVVLCVTVLCIFSLCILYGPKQFRL